MQHVIFYSWEADRPNNTNRGFIKNALEEAATALASDLTVEPRIDHDTQNVPGSPDIARTILKKIENSDVFVADVTIINDPKDKERPTPNPNVLIELGYALKALGEDRLILVINDHFGPVEQLPFDLRGKRNVIYTISPDAQDKATERRRLASILKAAIKAAIDSIPQAPPAPTSIEIALNAIETAAPNRVILVRNTLREITSELEALAPPQFRSGGTVEQLLAALETTIPAVRAFTLLAHATAAMNDHDAARALYKALIPVFEHYENPVGFSGSYQEADFDYWRFLGHELLVSLIAPLLTEERYEIITALLDEPLTVATALRERGKPTDFTCASDWLRSFERLDREHRKLSYHGYLLQQRHDGPLADVLPLKDFLAADYLLFLRGELANEQWEERGVAWVPWSSVYLRDTPDFVHSAARTAVAERLATTLRTPDVATLKARLKERAGKLANIWGNVGMRRQPLTTEQVDRIGTR